MKHGFGGATALALVFALSACGGGGGVNSTPAPTPAATYATLDQLSGTQTFETASINVPVFRGNSSSATGYKAGSAVRVDYDASAGAYMLTSPEGYSVAMTQANYDSALSNNVRSVYGKSDSTAGDNVWLWRLMVKNVRLSYTMFGTWRHVPAGSVITALRDNLFVGGVQTQKSDIPKSGTASYDTYVGGSVMSDDTTYTLSDPNTGTSESSATFSLNFGTGSVNTTLNLAGTSYQTGVSRNFGSFTGTGSLDSGGPGFSGTLAGSNATGAFTGSLFGPQGAEMGYVWYAAGSGFEGSGIVAGIKK
ncbi:transferrin-binding protein-like solute binding protein [Novosphingobium naphthalenivorans]|uniref:transferrin-binding protein-like solute binding protein n=1 Tax=Novosphingobium naphthalenivorans TaxID=273168 RepID=UPI000ABA534F|nr:transferrin-binding protein-like solute binding protein [Novosphingobium naphthalenivorans]